MELPLQISARNVILASATEEAIRRAAEKLEGVCERLVSCRVLVEAAHRFSSGGEIDYNVRIDLTLPGAELLVTRQPQQDLLTAVQDAFEAARRRLEEHARRRREDARRPAARPLGRVSRLFPFEGYGFLETAEGYEVYFHRNSVLKEAFDRLEVGSQVRFVEQAGERGPQASTVVLPRKRRARTKT